MEKKHEIILDNLFYSMQDDLSDSWKNFNSAKKSKEYGDIETTKFFLNDAKSRIEHSCMVKTMIENYIKVNKLNDEGVYKSFYHFTLDSLEELKTKIYKFTM